MKISIGSRVCRTLGLTVVLAFIAHTTDGQEQPADTTFEQSAFRFDYKIPSSFTPLPIDTGYFPTPVGQVPFRVQSWRGKTDTISIKITVMPEVWWQTRSEGAFVEAAQSIRNDPKTKVLSERDYSISGCKVHSITFDQPGDYAEFQRIDYFLVKPDLRVVIYTSPNESILNGAARTLFDSISIKPKTHL